MEVDATAATNAHKMLIVKDVQESVAVTRVLLVLHHKYLVLVCCWLVTFLCWIYSFLFQFNVFTFFLTTDVDECARRLDSCDPTSRCWNFVGGYTCLCNIGYRKLSNGKCIDIDECMERRNDLCHPDAFCTNLPGSYICKCKAGYIGMLLLRLNWLLSKIQKFVFNAGSM